MDQTDKAKQLLFWGCFIALITTAFGFITRMFLLDDTSITEGLLKLDPAEVGRFKGIQVWPFAVSIILFSLIIDKVGYKFSMIFAAVCQLAWAIMGVTGMAIASENPELAKSLIFWGGLVLALGNGTVEAFINPVVATMFDKEKTKWLNILHAGWPGGLVVAGVLTISMQSLPWTYKLGIIAIPTLIYFFILIKQTFPVQERVAAGVTYRQMLSEFGVLGAAVVGFLLTLQLMDFFPEGPKTLFILIGVGLVAAFGLYTKSLGNVLLFVLMLIMMPLATAEIGTDGWISGIMASAVTFAGGWILVYTSLIMMVLRFFAGPIVHRLSPLGLLLLSSMLAVAGLAALSGAQGVMMIFAAATLYALGKTFFWPTMLGIVSEQTPKGGALTLNAISGIGMLAVGTLGFPYIGVLQTKTQQQAILASEEVKAKIPGLVQDGKITVLVDKHVYEVLHYQAIDDGKLDSLLATLPEANRKDAADTVKNVRARSNQKALMPMSAFPAFMLVCYIGLFVWFKSRGGYKAVHIGEANH